MSGYTACACRDCFETAISSDVEAPEMCHDCKLAGCNGGECQAVDSSGSDYHRVLDTNEQLKASKS